MITKVDALQMNRMNKREILHLIRKAGVISRADIAAISGLTAPTVSRIVEHLVTEEKLVSYVGAGESKGGRPPVMLKFNGKENYIVGIDLGATTIRGVLSDLDANIVLEIQIPTDINKGFIVIMDQVEDLVNKLLSRRIDDLNRVKGVGIAIAGLVNKTSGKVDFSPDFGWTNVDVRENLKERIALPFIYDNSTRLMALGEHEYGEGVNYDNFAVINIGYGIAAGIVVDGVPLKGSAGYAGELGHIIVDSRSNIQCKCGAMGCLEALASGRRIAQMGQAVAEKKRRGVLWDLCEGDLARIDARMVAVAADRGDKESHAIYQEITSYLSIGIATLANLLDPQIVFIGGGVSMNGDVFFDNIRNSVRKYLISPEKSVKIAPVTFGENASVIGALSLITSKITNFEPLN